MNVVAVIPAYNEEKMIKAVAERAKKFVDHVIVVDDGSSDKTAKMAKEVAEVITLEKNRGKAGALREGFKHCKNFDVVVILDGDLQHLPEEIPNLLECIKEGNDLCIGSRFLKDTKSMPRQCKFSNVFASRLITFLSGVKITDPQSGFRAIKSEKLEMLELRAERYAVEHIMILEAAKKKFKIKEVPMSCIYGEEVSSIRPFQDTIKVAYYITRFLLGA